MRKLGRKKAHREHMLRNLATSLILYERLTTTLPKTKEVKKIIDHLISLGKSKDLKARRQIIAYTFDNNAVKKLFDVIIPRYKDRTSGFTRIFHLPPRLGDSASMAIIELIPVEEKATLPTKPTKNEPEDIKKVKKESDAKPKAAKKSS